MKNSQITPATCPNCWGHQEYAGNTVQKMENRIFNAEQPHFIRRFVKEYLPDFTRGIASFNKKNYISGS